MAVNHRQLGIIKLEDALVHSRPERNLAARCLQQKVPENNLQGFRYCILCDKIHRKQNSNSHRELHSKQFDLAEAPRAGLQRLQEEVTRRYGSERWKPDTVEVNADFAGSEPSPGANSRPHLAPADSRQHLNVPQARTPEAQLNSSTVDVHGERTGRDRAVEGAVDPESHPRPQLSKAADTAGFGQGNTQSLPIPHNTDWILHGSAAAGCNEGRDKGPPPASPEETCGEAGCSTAARGRASTVPAMTVNQLGASDSAAPEQLSDTPPAGEADGELFKSLLAAGSDLVIECFTDTDCLPRPPSPGPHPGDAGSCLEQDAQALDTGMSLLELSPDSESDTADANPSVGALQSSDKQELPSGHHGLPCTQPHASLPTSTPGHVTADVPHEDATRARGGDWLGDLLESYQWVHDEDGEDEQAEALEPGAAAHLAGKLWNHEETVCPVNGHQALGLLSKLKERHRLSLAALEDILQLLKLLLPPNPLPGTVYLFRKLMREVLAEVMGGPDAGFTRIHMCPNAHCTYWYQPSDAVSQTCPDCGRDRYKTLKNEDGTQTRQAQRELRYLGLTQGIRLLMMGKQVSDACLFFQIEEECLSNHSLYSSELSEYLCRQFIPGFQGMSPQEQFAYKCRFLRTGQVCSEEEWVNFTNPESTNPESTAGTLLLVVEGGCDAFQPFKRRVRSTWLFGYRLCGVNRAYAPSGAFEIVTAIAEGAAEEQASHLVAKLDATELLALCPPQAADRPAGIMEAPLRIRTWSTHDDGTPFVYEVGAWVVCSGIQADAPMRQLLNRNLGCAAKRGCDLCGIQSTKGHYNASKYLGYSCTCRHIELDDTTHLPRPTPVMAWATGKIQSRKRTLGHVGRQHRPHRTTSSIPGPLKARLDAAVERKKADLAEKARQDKVTARQRIKPPAQDKLQAAEEAIDTRLKNETEQFCLEAGSRGSCELLKAGLPYVDPRWISPVAIYHCFYLGVGKDFMRFTCNRAGAGVPPDFAVSFNRPQDTLALLRTRIAQFVLRNKPDSIMVDFTAYLSGMSMSEMQLLFEVGAPYLAHDLRSWGVPAEFVAMWLLLRHAMMCMTRLVDGQTRAEYTARLRQGKVAFNAYAVIAQNLHEKGDKHSQFPFTWKLHMCCAHIMDQILATGHPIQASDAWVERMLRAFACRILKDKGGSSIENAIQMAHTDGHCARALELVVAASHVSGDDTPPPTGPQLPAAPGLADVRAFNSARRALYTQQREPTGGTQRRRRTSAKAATKYDEQDEGDSTVLLGVKLPNKEVVGRRRQEMKNAVGFFFYTNCRGNAGAAWPDKMAVRPGEAELRTGRRPQRWADCDPMDFADLFEYTAFARCSLYGDNLVTSAKYKRQKERDNSWIAIQAYTSPQARETRTCICKVQYFVKCSLVDEAAVVAARSLGIAQGTHRFAIVDAYQVEDVQRGIGRADASTPWGRKVFSALEGAGLMERLEELGDLFEAVQGHAAVLALRAGGAPVRLQHRGGRGGSLHRLAVPLSSRSYEYYGRPDASLGVHPMVRIDRAQASVKKHGVDETVQSRSKTAIDKIRETALYFVQSYSISNSDL